MHWLLCPDSIRQYYQKQNKDKLDYRPPPVRNYRVGDPMDVVRIFDTTLRDREQSPGFSMNTEEKIRLARQLAALNVDVIEAGFPIAARGDLDAVQKVAQEVRNVPIAALARARNEDVAAAIEALTPAAAPR